MARRATPRNTQRPWSTPDDIGRDPAIVRGLRIVELVAKSDSPLALATIGERLKLSKATVHRVANLLEKEGFLQREPNSRRFGPGRRLIGVAVDALCHSSVRGERHAIMRALVEKIGETCNFTMCDGSDVVYIDRVEAAWPLRLHLQPGSRVPLHCTASGKLFLSRMPARQRRRMLEALPLVRYTDNTIIDPHALEKSLQAIRRARVATDNEEFLDGLIAVAVPVENRRHRNRIQAALAVHAPTARLSLTRAMDHVDDLRAAAVRLARTLD